MRGKHYDAGKRRIFTTGGYLAVIIAVVIVAVVLAMTLLIYLPSTEEETPDVPTIVGISYDDIEIGVGSDLSKVYVKVSYSDGTSKEVAISNMISEGLDVTESGDQNVSLSFGGFEQTINVKVKDVNCTLTYTSSIGGRIQGTSKQSIVSGYDADTVVAIPETGYRFVEWSDGYPHATRKDLKVNESKGYIAKFEKAKYRVIFYYNDGTVASEEDVVYGEKATKAPTSSDPKMNVYGYSFSGWSVSEEDYSSVKRDMNIYPQYVKTATDVMVKVSIDEKGSIMGGTNANECGYYTHDVLATITATPYNSREFNCWYILNAFGEIETLSKNEERIIVIGDNRVNVTFKSNSSGNSASEYVLSFIPTDEIATIELTAGFVYMSSSVSFINYQNDKANNQEYYIDGITYGVTLGEYINEYVKDKDTSVTIDESTNIIKPADVTGMTFLGWYLKGDSTQTLITENILFGEPTTLVAKWGKQSYTIRFTYVDETNTTQLYDTISVVYQNTIGSGGGVPNDVPSKANYNFVGWMDALTGDMIDDKTQISLKSEYLVSDAFINKNEISIIAKWEPKEHTLTVNSKGAGTVYVTKSGQGIEPITEVIHGIYTIYETYNYKVSFMADSGNTVDNARWDYSDVSEIYNGTDTDMSTLTITLQKLYDNVISVDFAPKKFTVIINNGNESYSGYVDDGSSIYDNQTINTAINYSDTLNYNIRSYNEVFTIEKIFITGIINGKNYDNELFVDLTDKDNLEYSLILENCISDVVITIEYLGRNYFVDVIQPNAHGKIYTTTFNGAENILAQPQKEYIYGDVEHFVFTADEGKYISSVRVDGIKTDVYKNSSDNLIFYDWEINGKSLGISLKYVNDEYIYCYGGAVVNGVEYIYCETLISGETRLYKVIDAENEEYERIYATDAGISYEEIIVTLNQELNVEGKKVSDSSINKDLRITKVKAMYIATKNASLTITHGDIVYSISVKDDTRGNYSVNKTEVVGGESVNINVTPTTGYYVSGYIINGGETIPVSAISQGATCNVKLNDVREDVSVEIVYAEIKYNVVFVNSTHAIADVFVTNGEIGGKLSTTYSYEYGYAGSGEFTITIEDGYYVTSLQINGVEQPLSYMMVKYVYVNNNVTSDVEIVVKCAEIDTSISENGYLVNIDADNVENVVANVAYGENTSTNNEIYIIANQGYYLENIYLRGYSEEVWRDINVKVTDNATIEVSDTKNVVLASDIVSVAYSSGYKNALRIKLSADAFDEETTLYVRGVANKYSLNITSAGEGEVTGLDEVNHGEKVTVVITAKANHYISSYKVNGKEISFRNSNFDNLVYSNVVQQYIGGTYTFVASGDTDVEVSFSMYSYAVNLDKTSTNGTTKLSVEGSDEELTRIKHGETLIISMTADEGYHIEDVLVNGVSVGYEPYSEVANDNVTHTYTLKEPATGNITVKVVYAINRYEFNYQIINDSANFSNTSGSGTINVPEYSLVEGKDAYTGIAHGDNFYFEIMPSVGFGYYLYSVSIKYKGYGQTEDSIVYRQFDDGDGIVNQDGGTIWFNRFMYGNNADSAMGVTANIELIQIVFKRHVYEFNFAQTSELVSGTLEFSVTNPNNATQDVIIFDEFNNEYVYRPQENKIYKLSVGILTETDVSLTYADERWYFYSVSENKEYSFRYEYGLRYVVTTKASLGYERVEFIVNEEDRLSSVNNDKYGMNVYRDVTISVRYQILTFEVMLSATIYNSAMNKVSQVDFDNYIEVKVIDALTEEILLTLTGKKVDTVKAQFDYGRKIKLVVLPKFDTTGIYLYSLIVNNLQQGGLGDTSKEVVYGNDGISLTGDLNFKTTFRVKTYTISLKTKYIEDIKNENLNTFANDTTSSYAWNVYWNENSVIKIIAGAGYKVDRISIFYQENGVERELNINNYYLIEDNYGTEESGFTIERNNESVIYGLRDLLTIYRIKSDFNVEAYFDREEYVAIYNVNDVTAIDTIETRLNEYNGNYPKSQKNTLQLPVRAYDELTVLIEPTDGFEITDAYAVLECVVYDEELGEYVVTYDEFGNAMIYNFKLTDMGTGEGKMFTFHEATNAITDYYISGNVRISFNLVVKRYTLTTSIVRTKASHVTATENDTTPIIRITDVNGDRLVISGGIQYETELKPDDLPMMFTAEHNGTIRYVFATPTGYKLDTFVINGYTKEQLVEKGIMTITETKMENNGVGDNDRSSYYYYEFIINVSTALIIGSIETPWMGSADINVSMAFVPITYNIKVVIDNVGYDYAIYNNRNGATDNEKLLVYTPQSVMHFASFTVEPSLYEGYMLNGVGKLYIGTQDGYDESDVLVDFYDIEGNTNDIAITGRKSINANAFNTYLSNALIGKTVIYVVFNTKIVKYNQIVETKVFYNKDGSVVEEDLTENPNVGDVTIKIEKEGNIFAETTDGKLDANGEGYEYFSTVEITAKAKDGYALYGVYEIITEGDEEIKVKVANNSRGVSYGVVEGTTILRYQIDGYGNRKFILEFKQKTTVTVYVENPYKYVVGSSGGYKYYTSLIAYEEGIVVNNSSTDTNLVVEEYKFNVYVGNRIVLQYKDAYGATLGQEGVNYYNKDIRALAEDNLGDIVAYEKAIENTLVPDLKADGDSGGHLILGGSQEGEGEVFYMFTNVYARVVAEEVTISAKEGTGGGKIYFNGVYNEKGILVDQSDSKAGKILTIKILEEANNAFYQIRVKKVDEDKSKETGTMTFNTSETQKWASLNIQTLNSASDKTTVVNNFNAQMKNRFLLFDYRKISDGGYEFDFWVCGDMELEVEFYHVYNVNYGIYCTNRVARYGEEDGIITSGVEIVNVVDTVFGEDGLKNEGKVSYSTVIDIKVEDQGEEYQFVGWYVNDVNMFAYLHALLPTDDFLQQRIEVNLEKISGLLAEDGSEINDLYIYAVFQPIINVTVFNEKYYAFDDHFNSWDMGEVAVKYYNFNASDRENACIEGIQTTARVVDNVGKLIDDYNEYINDTQAYNSYYDSNYKWNDVLNDLIIANYDDTLRNNRIYSAFADMTMLTQNITNDEFIKFSWESSKLGLSMSSMPSDVQFYAWEYFNWNTLTWELINYKYEDASLGVTSNGTYITVDCYSAYYDLNLDYLFKCMDEEGTMPYMPYAISSEDATNFINDRPLLIRANTYKQVAVNLKQYAYLDDFANQIDRSQQYPLSSNVVSPEIITVEPSTDNVDRQFTDVANGLYEYGTTITIVNNSSNHGGEVLSGTNIRYRFIGWFYEMDNVDYYMNNSENSSDYVITLTSVSDTSNTTFNFFAYYVMQYRQEAYSYNISGGGNSAYATASTVINSVFSAPILTVRTYDDDTNYNKPISFVTLNKIGGTNNSINYGVTETVVKYYWINNVDMPYSRANSDADEFEYKTRNFAYFIDVGLKYNVEVDTDGDIDGITMSAVKTGATGFCPDCDTLYQFIVNNTVTVDYSGYYNTGKATYYVGNKATTAQDLTERAGNTVMKYFVSDDTTQSNEYQIRYVSTGTLVFYNFTYKGGITVPSTLAKVITAGQKEILTVWDEDATFGDWYSISNGVPIGYDANGEVVIKVTLINVTGVGYAGNYNFTFAGMQSGNGMDAQALTFNGGLLSPIRSGYKRWYEIDQSNYATTFMFGNSEYSQEANTNKIGDHVATASKYCTKNTGDAESGYRILDVDQFKNIETFWENNAYSCQGVIEPDKYDFEQHKDEEPRGKTIFLVCNNLNLQSLTVQNASGNPASGGNPTWTPLCISEEDVGFDGILTRENTGDYYIYGLATSNNATDYYGIFSKIIGGEVNDLIFDNAYLEAVGGTSAGIITGYAKDAKFTSITFKKMTNYAMGKMNYFDNSTALDSTNVNKVGATTIKLTSDGNYVGALAGWVVDSEISDVSLDIGSGNSVYVDGASVTMGALIGKVEGGVVKRLSVSGAGWIVMNLEGSGGKSFGGLIGAVEGGALVETITLIDTNIIAGSTSAIAVGGIIGTIDGMDTVVQYITIKTGCTVSSSSTDVTFSVDVDNNVINASGIVLLANRYSSSDKSYTSKGKVGAVVGEVMGGTLNNYNSTTQTYHVINSCFKAYAGTIGGIAGANSGLVTGFNLNTGTTATDANRFFIVGAIAGNSSSHSYNVGGVVGINTGTVNDCGYTNTGNVSSTDYSNWHYGSMIVYRYDDGRTIYTENGGKRTTKLNFNLVMGGIVAYSTGNVYNSFVTGTRLTYKIDGNVYDTKSTASFISKYSFGLEAGLIVGVFEPNSSATIGIGNQGMKLEEYMSNGDSPEDIITKLHSLNMTTSRIQSCYSKNSSIVIAGRVYIDDFGGMGPKGGDYAGSTETAIISMAGICGNVEGYNGGKEYTINGCYAEGNGYFFKVNSWGAASSSGTSANVGFRRDMHDPFGGNTYYSWVNRAFFDCNLVVRGIVGGGVYNSIGQANIFMPKSYSSYEGIYRCWYENSGINTGGDPFYRYIERGWGQSEKYPDNYDYRWVRITSMEYGSQSNDYTYMMYDPGVDFAMRFYENTTGQYVNSFCDNKLLMCDPYTGGYYNFFYEYGNSCVMQIGYINDAGEEKFYSNNYESGQYYGHCAIGNKIYGIYGNKMSVASQFVSNMNSTNGFVRGQ